MMALDWRLCRTLLVFMLAPSGLLKGILAVTLALLVAALVLAGLGYPLAGVGSYLAALCLFTPLLLAAPTQFWVLCSRKTWLLLGHTLLTATILVVTLGLVWALLLLVTLSVAWGFAAAASGVSALYFVYSLFCWSVLLRRFEIVILLYFVFLAGYFGGVFSMEWVAPYWGLGFLGLPAAVWGWWRLYLHSRRTFFTRIDIPVANPFPFVWGGAHCTGRMIRVEEGSDPLALLLTSAQTFLSWRLKNLLLFLGVAVLAAVFVPFVFEASSLAQLGEAHQRVLSGFLIVLTMLNFGEQQNLVIRRLRGLWLYSECDRETIVRLWTRVSRHMLAWQCLSLAAVWVVLNGYFSPGDWLARVCLLAALLALAQRYWQPLLLHASAFSRFWQYTLGLLVLVSLFSAPWWTGHPVVVTSVFLLAAALTLWLRRLAGRRLQRLDLRRWVS